MSYYRELVRNQFDEPEKLQPIRRWTKAPNFYIHKRNPRTDNEGLRRSPTAECA
jgi:hypothetical protein